MSALGDAAANYLAFRRAFGLKLDRQEQLLTDFVDYLDRHGTDTVTIDAAIGWATGPATSSPHRIAERLPAARRFAQYLVAFDPTTEIPPVHLLRVGSTRRAPHVFTAEEVQALMSAASRLSPPIFATSFTTLIGLMSTAGLRTMEVVRLDRADLTLDTLDAGRLLVRHTKYGKTRQIPLHPSATAALRAYLARRDQLCPDPTESAVFLAANGQRLRRVGETFSRLIGEVGISVPPNQRRPRAHDLRHTFAVNTVRDWHAAGLDVEAQLPALSTYLGHLNPANTYWYLQAVPELMGVLADRVTAWTEARS